MHIVSDFDGVWTNPEAEYQAVESKVISEIAHSLDCDLEIASLLYAGFAKGVLASPSEFGWQADPEDPRLSSFVDEDFFCLPAAVGHYIELAASEDARRVKVAILQKHPSLPAFMDHCFHNTCADFRKSVDHDLTQGAIPILQWLLDRGHGVTWATNAPAEKICDWMGAAGFEVEDGSDDSSSFRPGVLRVFGRCGKQWLGDGEQAIEFLDRQVLVDRPRYRKLLEQERPDILIGDVLSLDLSTALQMRQEGSEAAPPVTVLVGRRPLPAWVHEAVGDQPQQLDHLIPHLTRFPRIVAQAQSTLSPSVL